MRPLDPVTFSVTCAVTLRPAESRREEIESSRAAWISVPIGSVRRLMSLADSAGGGWGLPLVAVSGAAGAVSRLGGAVSGTAEAVSGTAATVSAAAAAVSREVVSEAAPGVAAMLLSRDGAGTVSDCPEAVSEGAVAVFDSAEEAESAEALVVPVSAGWAGVSGTESAGGEDA